MELEPAAAAWVAEAAGSPVAEATRLAGGLDALTLRCDLADGRTLVLRTLPDPEVAGRQPLRTDLTLLRALEGRNLPVPQVVAADEHGEQVGHPALLLTWCEGRVEGDPYAKPAAAQQVCDVLAAVHTLEVADGLPRLEGTRVRRDEPWAGLGREPLAGALRDRLRALLPEENRPLVPIHGDAWVGNLVWDGGVLTGLIDWSDSVLSDPAADFALVRLDFSLLRGTEAGLALRSAEHQGFWDLWAATQMLANLPEWQPIWGELGSGLDYGETHARLRGHCAALLDLAR